MYSPCLQSESWCKSCYYYSSFFLLCSLFLTCWHFLFQKIDEDKLFNLFSIYGNIVRIKLLRNKTDHALVQMGDGFQAELAVHFLKVWLFKLLLFIVGYSVFIPRGQPHYGIIVFFDEWCKFNCLGVFCFGHVACKELWQEMRGICLLVFRFESRFNIIDYYYNYYNYVWIVVHDPYILDDIITVLDDLRSLWKLGVEVE